MSRYVATVRSPGEWRSTVSPSMMKGRGEEDHRRDGEHDERHRHDCGDRLPGVVLVARREARHEDRNECRGQDPSENEVLHDVGNGVRQVVGVRRRPVARPRYRGRTRERRSGPTPVTRDKSVPTAIVAWRAATPRARPHSTMRSHSGPPGAPGRHGEAPGAPAPASAGVAGSCRAALCTP